MKYIIASDIHGSAKYCQLLLQKFNEEKADKILLLGDILYHGPRNDLPDDYKGYIAIHNCNSWWRIKSMWLETYEAPKYDILDFEKSNFKLKEIDRNYFKEGEPMTAYQAKFTAEGKPIYYAKN